MIGVIANPADRRVVAEFFQLFKTPWEFYRNDHRYEVLLCDGDSAFDERSAKLVLLYAGREIPFDVREKTEISPRKADSILSYEGKEIPIYGDSITFGQKAPGTLVDEQTGEPATHQHRMPESLIVRIGYDLFSEIRTLLTQGQPVAHAGVPTLDLHIAMLRNLVLAGGGPMVEIPPVPEGYRFTVCLTHDVDHPSIRGHKFDHTTLGFLYRAVFVSLSNLFRGRISARNLLTNWAAALKLPFVHMGWAKDFWRDFDDRYLELERGLSSTFFVIPFKNYPGRNSHGLAPRFRAAGYDAQEIAGAIRKFLAAGCEVGLHGIDAWLDSTKGREELDEIRKQPGGSEVGVRMHWLYYDQESPVALEQAEAAYDSTVGYNETVGYRAGTTQVYKPLEATRLLELPLHVMDTALFYPSHLGLSPQQATAILGQLVDNAVQFGGCLTINWHDRSLAPERLWDDCYRDLVRELKARGGWFATASQATSWFRNRRSVVFETDPVEPDRVPPGVADDRGRLPGMQFRVHNAGKSCESDTPGSRRCIDRPATKISTSSFLAPAGAEFVCPASFGPR